MKNCLKLVMTTILCMVPLFGLIQTVSGAEGDISTEELFKINKEVGRTYPTSPLPKDEIWQPKRPPASAPTETTRFRVLDFGGDFGRYPERRSSFRATVKVEGVDIDGDLSTEDSVVSSFFSLKVPMSSGYAVYDDTLTSAVYHGGSSIFYADRKSKKGFTEYYCNIGEGRGRDKPNDNWSTYVWRSIKNKPFKVALTFIWKKDISFVGPAQWKDSQVFFDKTSRLGFYRQRHGPVNVTGEHFVVKNGDQLYLSERIIPEGRRALYILSPTETKWTKWNPREGAWDFFLDREKAEWIHPEFNDIQAIGWYYCRDEFGEGAFGYKWECMDTYAQLTRPKMPSFTLDMKEIPSSTSGGEKVAPFYMSTTEVPYAVWHEIHRWSRGPDWALEPGRFLYDRDGDMGSIDKGFEKHSQREPVTDITLYDALAFSNALSIKEGRTPVYYTDSTFSEIYREVVRSDQFLNPEFYKRPTIYVNWDADGFRLPTEAEWDLARADATEVVESAWTSLNSTSRTKDVGTLQANSNGLYDMIGNTWELVWGYGDQLLPDPDTITVMGGGFNYPQDPITGPNASGNPYGERPYDGHSNIGLRLVRRNSKAGPAGQTATVSKKSPRWDIGKMDQTTAIKKVADIVEIPLCTVPEGSFSRWESKKRSVTIQMSSFEMGQTEVSYRQWKQVRDWGEAHGYEFNNDGDMGSMDFRLKIHEHGPDEPVTDVNYYDAWVWCNALSEMKGLKPLMYDDEEKTIVTRKSWRTRPSHFRDIDKEAFYKDKLHLIKEGAPPGFVDSFEGKAKYARNPDLDKGYRPGAGKYWVAWDANGYRLPTWSEYHYVLHAGNPESIFPWAEGSEKEVGKYAWYGENSEMRTHNVGTRAPTVYGIQDMLGNAMEWMGDFRTMHGKKLFPAQTKNPIKGTPSESYPLRFGFALATSFQTSRIKYFQKKKESWSAINYATIRHPDMGFRIARPIDEVSITIDGKEYRVTGPLTEEVSKLDGNDITVNGDISGDTIHVKLISKGGLK